MARLIDPETYKPMDTPRPLFDVTLDASSGDCLRLTGFERVNDELFGRYRDYVQTWQLELAPSAEVEHNGS